METGPKLNATGARPSKANARKQEVPQYGAYPTVRHLAGSRVPFSTAFVVSSTGQPRSEVGGVMKDAFEWGWINQTGDVGTDGEYLWIGRL
jgi:hypothetical protein